MPKLNPCSRRELVRKLRAAGFQGPHPGGRHEWMEKGSTWITVPNPHGGNVDVALLRRLLRQVGLTIKEWNDL